jgi:flagellar protein FlaF
VNAAFHARQAYAPGISPLRSARSAELDVISQITARLSAATGAPFAVLAAAIHEKRRLWSRFAAAVADDGNGLPATLRAQIFYLAEFTELHSRKVLAGDGDIAALIDINAAVMRGLGSPTAVQVPT